MNLCRGIALAALLALTASLSLADEPKKDEPKKDEPKQGRTGQFQQRVTAALLTPAALEKLKLTDEQKKQYDKIETEYTAKQKDITEKLQTLIQNPGGQTLEEIQKLRTEQTSLRTETLDKIEPLLNDEQKKTFAEVKQVQGPGRAQGSGGFGRPGGRVQGDPVSEVLSKTAQDKLKLTDEQKKKVEELQKEVDAKLRELMTDEQKKQFDDLKKEPRTPPRRANPVNP